MQEKDWKLYRSLIGTWQENYMDYLTKEYVKILTSSSMPSTKFYTLLKRINKDKYSKGVIVKLSRSNVIYDVACLINHKIISLSDIKDFSDEFKEKINLLIRK